MGDLAAMLGTWQHGGPLVTHASPCRPRSISYG